MGENKLMSYPPNADPIFYDDSIWIDCNVCGQSFDESEYRSLTCSDCETELQDTTLANNKERE